MTQQQQPVIITLPQGYTLRRLNLSDFENNYCETLQVLTTVGEISQKQFNELFQYWESLPEIYNPHVITNQQGKIVATGMLLVERKLIHSCGLVGHIEDISVLQTEQGKSLGLYIVRYLANLAKARGCYKVILDCSPENIKFYNKCGFNQCGIEMSQRFD
ncbi:GNA1 [[Candida] subhashii]|uniref:Glucosamine 6-phosphate N-acetyltransferase n=1 Tax=[Candida] subhashii TaxID=561895 RepID=A0A8J5UKD2_9ASCO|nr:GNA1 [[Candida] subhashii]KAG7665388.1 GNA1 [[Candida] subhashii]